VVDAVIPARAGAGAGLGPDEPSRARPGRGRMGAPPIR